MSIMKEKDEPQVTNTVNEQEEKNIDNKLSDLMEMGWILLEENCPLESCHCPLLKILMEINIVLNVKCGNFQINEDQDKDILI